MSTLEATVTSRKPANPFVQVSQGQILSDLAESRQQIAAGQGLDMEDALNRLGKQHGFNAYKSREEKKRNKSDTR